MNRKDIVEILKEDFSHSGVFNVSELKKSAQNFFMIRYMASRFLSQKRTNERLLLNNIIISINIHSFEKTFMILKQICNDDEFGVVRSCMEILNCFPIGEVFPEINVELKERLIKSIQERTDKC